MYDENNASERRWWPFVWFFIQWKEKIVNPLQEDRYAKSLEIYTNVKLLKTVYLLYERARKGISYHSRLSDPREIQVPK